MAIGDQIHTSGTKSTQSGLGGGSDIDPNAQTGTDQFGNPINGHGLPLGQEPPPPPPGDPNLDPYGKPIEHGMFYDYGQSLKGANTYRPQVNAPSISSPGMTAAQMSAAGMDTTQADQDRSLGIGARNQQTMLGGAIMQRALGQGGPSVAELQMRRGVGMAQQAAAHQAASARGLGRGLAAYGAANAQANLASQGVQDASALRAQETIAAQGLAQKNLSDQRMQDLTSRGMSIQQAQAIMDAENRARETNVNATNRARETSLNSNMQAQQSNLQADTALRGMTTQITEGEAARKQKGAGIVPALVGTTFTDSDVRAKMDVQPLYSAPLAVPGQEQEPTVEERSRQMQQDKQLGDALTRMGNGADVGGIPASPYPDMAVQPPDDDNPFAGLVPAPPPKQEKKGMFANILSDERAKTDAFLAGMKLGITTPEATPPRPPEASTPMLKKASVSSAPAFDLSPDRVRRVGRETFHQAIDEREDQQKLADAFKFLGQMQGMAPEIRNQVQVPPPVAPQPPTAPVAQLQPTATSDKRAKYSYSDEKAKELTDENAMLKAALGRMGNEVSAQIKGEQPGPTGLGAALTKMGNSADVSGIPTAAYPDVSADSAREANPPPGYQYRYKPESAAKQGTDTDPRLGFMAQDALKSPMYRPAVVKMPDGMLGIDQNRLLHANTAMLSGEHKRLDEAEERDRQLAEAIAAVGNKRAGEIRDFR